jgi:hypothetical protein
VEGLKLGFEIGKWAVETIAAFIAGDDGPEPKRLAEILPDKLRSDVEHARQRRLLEAELRGDLDAGEHPDDEPEASAE